MRRKRSGRIWWALLVLLIVLAAVLTGYYLGKETTILKGSKAANRENPKAGT